MKVIFLADILGTGKKGAIKDVSDGYARNFLLPKHLAKPASDGAIEELKSHEAKVKREVQDELRRFQHDAARLDGQEVYLVEKTTVDGVLYAAVSSTKIAAAIKQHIGLVINPKHIHTPQPIKRVGSHTAMISFPHGLEAEITVTISDT